MKYNKSEIMKAAWNMVKVAGMTISAALKNAWAAAKSVIKTIVDGTDKQNAWANEILRKPIAQVKESISWLEVEIKYGHTVKSIEPLRAAIAEYEKNGTIVGYKALVDWDKTEREIVSAVIELKVTPKKETGFDDMARIADCHDI